MTCTIQTLDTTSPNNNGLVLYAIGMSTMDLMVVVNPVGIWCQNVVVSASMRRHTSHRRLYDIILRHVPAGNEFEISYFVIAGTISPAGTGLRYDVAL